MLLCSWMLNVNRDSMQREGRVGIVFLKLCFWTWVLSPEIVRKVLADVKALCDIIAEPPSRGHRCEWGERGESNDQGQAKLCSARKGEVSKCKIRLEIPEEVLDLNTWAVPRWGLYGEHRWGKALGRKWWKELSIKSLWPAQWKRKKGSWYWFDCKEAWTRKWKVKRKGNTIESYFK